MAINEVTRLLFAGFALKIRAARGQDKTECGLELLTKAKSKNTQEPSHAQNYQPAFSK
jgi:hypothetical protein